MHAALAFLLVLTIHRCYPTGVPRFLQGDLMRRQIRRYYQTLTILWTFAILINLPLFAITKYETIQHIEMITMENNTNITYSTFELSCFTGATEIWSRTYLILLLVCTYFITGIFLIVIYGQVIRIILASKKYANNPIRNTGNNCDHYRYLSANDQYRSKFIFQIKSNRNRENLAAQSTSSLTCSSNRRQQQNDLNQSSTNSHSTQHVQIIVMLFIVILLYILLLLPYRLLNLLYIVHNQLFQQTFMNEILFRWLLNSVRLLVFLNCALQPITYLIISSRLRQTVNKLLRSWFKCFCTCQCSSTSTLQTKRHHKSDTRAIQAYLSQKHHQTNQHQNPKIVNCYRHSRPLPTSLNNLYLAVYPCAPLNSLPSSRLPLPTDNNRYPILFTNKLRT
jgi:hypothetical protein